MFGTYERLGLPVWAGWRQVIRAARLKIALHDRAGQHAKAARRNFYALIMWEHFTAQDVVREWRL